MVNRKITIALFGLWPALALAGTYRAPLDVRAPGKAEFTRKPRVVRKNGGLRISFAVSAAIDVEVAVLDAKGKVVRHLAAGLLGKNAPAPLAKNSLQQELLWDGKDDLGNPTRDTRHATPLRVRVRLGSQARLEKYIGWSGNRLQDGVLSLAVGAKGELFVLLASGCWAAHGRAQIRVFDRKGNYLRTILPYRANTPEERLRSVGRLEVDGEKIPVVFDCSSHTVAPLTRRFRKQNMVYSPKGHLVLASGFDWYTPRHLLAVHAEGGAPAGMDFVGPWIADGKKKDMGIHFEHLATSPDGNWVYYVPFDGRPRNVVFRTAWGEKRLGKPFIGEEGKAGDDGKHLSDPQGVATDRHGRIYVCDRGNKRVAVFSPQGKPLGHFPAVAPEQIAVHPTGGEIYVVTRQKPSLERRADISSMSMSQYKRWKKAEKERKAKLPPPEPPAITKFSAWPAPGKQGGEKPRKLARLELNIGVMALDGEASPPRIWVTVKRGGLLPLTDRGKSFEIGEPLGKRDGVRYPTFLVADPTRNRLLYRDQQSSVKRGSKAIYAIDLASGKRRALVGATEIALCPDGTIVGTGGYRCNALYRFDSEGKPLAWKATGTNKIEAGTYCVYGVDLGLRGLCADLHGNVYFVRSHRPRASSGGIGSRVDVFNPEGKKIKAAIVDGLGYGDCGVGVDARGNIYVGSNIKPGDSPFPKAFTGKVPAEAWLGWRANAVERKFPWNYMHHNPCLEDWGSVVKFGPAGGKIYGYGVGGGRDMSGHGGGNGKGGKLSPLVSVGNAPAGAAVLRSAYLRREVRVTGAEWSAVGTGIIPSSDLGRTSAPAHCCCIGSRLAVDPYGRVFAPDCFRFAVRMLDTAGNSIARIGSYGNMDSRGPGSPVPKPEIAFVAPRCVAVAGDSVYVSDPMNQRIVAVRLHWSAEADCTLRSPEQAEVR